MTISGLGPHGERAAPPERVSLLPDDRTAAKSAGWRVAVVLSANRISAALTKGRT